MAQGKSFRAKTIRLLPQESAIIERACAALNGVERSQLVQEAVLVEANRLGIRWSATGPKPLTVSWPYLPDRKEEPTEVRLTLSVSLPLAEVLKRCADHVHASEPLFIIGATLAYIGRLQKCFRGIALDTPEEAVEIKEKLRRIKVPSQYEYQVAPKD